LFLGWPRSQNFLLSKLLDSISTPFLPTAFVLYSKLGMTDSGITLALPANDTVLIEEEHDTFTREELDRAIKQYNEERQVSMAKLQYLHTL